MRKLVVLLTVVSLGLLGIAAGVSAQDDPKPQIKWMGRGATSNDLVDVLKPRGIGQVAAKEDPKAEPAQPTCEKYRSKLGAATRGVAPVGAGPVSDYAAIEILFEFNSANLTPQAKTTLDQLGKALVSDELKQYCFVVEGHTDDVGGDAYNRRLSEMRAESAVSYLSDNFDVDSGRLVAVGLGESKPFDDNATEEGRQKNRRVQVANVGQ